MKTKAKNETAKGKLFPVTLFFVHTQFLKTTTFIGFCFAFFVFRFVLLALNLAYFCEQGKRLQTRARSFFEICLWLSSK